MTGQDNIIELRGVDKSFEDTRALEGIDLSISNGEFLTLLGPSGCGKTTILRILSGFETPDQGDVSIGGQRMNDVPPERRQVNTVFQNYALFPHMTVRDNVAFGLRMQSCPKGEIEGRVLEALRMVHLEQYADRRPHQLSGGQQQRVAIARAVVNKPLVLLLDEPFSALDYKLRRAMQLEIKRLQRRLGITFVFVTHDQEEAFAMFRRRDQHPARADHVRARRGHLYRGHQRPPLHPAHVAPVRGGGSGERAFAARGHPRLCA